MALFPTFARALSRLDSLNNWIRLFCILLTCAYVLSLGAAYLWVFDLFRHFIVHYAMLALLFGALAAARKIWPYAALMLALTGVCGYEVFSRIDNVPAQEAEALEGAHLLKVIVYNRHHSLTEHQAMVDFILAEDPDIFFILEANESHAQTLKTTLADAYPHQFLMPKGHAFGMVAASKHKFTLKWAPKSHLVEGLEGVPNFIMLVKIQPEGAKPVKFYALHAPPPMLPVFFRQRNAELAHVAALINQQNKKPTDNVILLGDWNITPYSPFFGQLLADTGFKNQTTAPYFLPSWPARLPSVLQIPIDHILHRGGLTLIEKRLGPSLGSDHHAVVAVFKIEN